MAAGSALGTVQGAVPTWAIVAPRHLVRGKLGSHGRSGGTGADPGSTRAQQHLSTLQAIRFQLTKSVAFLSEVSSKLGMLTRYPCTVSYSRLTERAWALVQPPW